jgi:hypothetical protein
MYIPRNWEFGSALAKLRTFGGGGGVENPQTQKAPSVRHGSHSIDTGESFIGSKEIGAGRNLKTGMVCVVK